MICLSLVTVSFYSLDHTVSVFSNRMQQILRRSTELLKVSRSNLAVSLYASRSNCKVLLFVSRSNWTLLRCFKDLVPRLWTETNVLCSLLKIQNLL